MKTKADYLLYSDESCPLEFDGNDVMAIGFIYCLQEDKDTIFKELRELKTKHNINSRVEIKWSKVSSKRYEYYKDAIDYFFNKGNIGIRILLAKGKTKLNHKKYNNGSYNEWYYKMYYFMLNKVIDENYKYFMMFDQKERETLYRLKVVKRNLISHKNKCSISNKFDFEIKQINSKESELMQILDLFLGAVTYKNRGLYEEKKYNNIGMNTKDKLIEYIQSKYVKLNESSRPYETKFNLFIWNPMES